MNEEDKKLSEGILFTDLYQLTMAQVYFYTNIHEKNAQFDYFFRDYPDYGSHKAGYCLSAGLEWLIDWIQEVSFDQNAISYLKSLKDKKGNLLFRKEFLDYLPSQKPFSGLSIEAIPEGRVIHSNVPITIVNGPLLQAQLLESALLNHLNFQSLIATKAARIHDICQNQPMLDFGLRRAQGLAANAAARAAIIGGAAASSNVGISKYLGVPPSGTHAHSMVQAVIGLGGSEIDAFRAYAEMYPDNCILLVDTIDTLESGIPNAIQIFEELRDKGHKPIGIRLDSGDLAYLSIQSAIMLDNAGFKDVLIVLSNQLDELVIWQIITQIKEESHRYGIEPDKLIKRLAYGIGTRLVTSAGDPALDGVYKLVAVESAGGWQPAMKISESPDKTLNPGKKKVWRLYDQREKAIADMIALSDEDPRTMSRICLRHPSDHTKYRYLDKNDISIIEPLLEPIFVNGSLVYQKPTLKEIQDKRKFDLEHLYPGVKRLMNPHHYHVSLSKKLWDLKNQLIHEMEPNNNH